ncbi:MULTISPECIES: HypC/HybG/HupF family hydrogenase formation chaperone [Thermomonospora]|uniref:Hydrogenase expression/formation protein HypC n=1 Tax=Thermomonospora cellulosilytica TaxID=1411118 RepID=A0A7W3MTJ1_9ACTN|nr:MULTISPECIES: HypC/HybG/HupF family hydrogenase formation chaperone [Thermomonospora]MBA9001624.1 hydrogenase expression/formation protein HypC [Thermomonospora cellulosilytica]
MCLGIPGEIVALVPDRADLATVEIAGVRRAVNIGLLGGPLTGGGVEVGDWVLVHVGFAMSKIDEAEAAATLALLRGLGEAYTDELDALAGSDIT